MSSVSPTSSFAIDVPQALLARARAGEPAAFEQLYRWFERPVFTLALRLTGQREEAQDILQDTMLKLFDRLGEFRGDSPFWGWLRQIAVNESLMQLRRRGRFLGKLSLPHDISKETAKLQAVVCYIDPAGGGANADETAYAIGGFLNGNVYLLSVGGIPGGYDVDKLEALALRIKPYEHVGQGPLVVKIEKNMGFGAFRAVFTPVLRKHVPGAGIEDDLVHGQKEARVINTLEPVMGRGSLIITEQAVRHDLETSSLYAPALRLTYSFFYQLAKISMTRNALVHDDRVDAVEGLVRHFTEALALDQKKQLASLAAKAHAEAISDPLGYNRYSTKPQARPSMLKRRR